MKRKRIRSFEEFWPFYVSQHRDPMNRKMHFLGTSLAGFFLFFGMGQGPVFWAVGLFCGYGFAWAGHFFYEKNHPATFRHPIWSFKADLHMYRLMLIGKMDEEVVRSTPIGRVAQR